MASNFNALMDPAQLGQTVQNAFMQGAQARALSNYAKNPSMGAASDVATLNPQVGIRLQDREREQQAIQQKAEQEAQERRIVGAALNGDPQARQQLAYFNSDLYLKLDQNQKSQVDQLYKNIAQQAFSILQLPEEQRGPAVQQALQGMQAQGIDTSQFRLSGDATADLKTALAMAGQLDEWERFAQPSYMAIPPGGTLVNTRDPNAIQQFGAQQAPEAGGQAFTFEQYSGAVNSLGPQGAAQWLQRNGIAVQVQTPDQARQLPSGTPIILPDGSPGRVP